MSNQSYPATSYAVPPELADFFNDFQELMRKHPRAADRYGLLDLGNNHLRRPIILESECFDFGGVRVCVDKERPE